jgi:hypothetical protein
MSAARRAIEAMVADLIAAHERWQQQQPADEPEES